MSIFRRRHHKSSKHVPVKPEVVSEEEELEQAQEQLNQLQNVLMRRKRSSKNKKSPVKNEDPTPDFKDALQMIMEKRRRKLAKRSKAQTCGVNIEDETINKIPEEIIETQIVNEQEDMIKPTEEQTLFPNKPQKKKTSTSTEKTSKAKSEAKPKKASASSAKPKKSEITVAKPKKPKKCQE